MDRNSIIGIALIAVILVIYGIVSTPSKEELEKSRAIKDSIEQVAKQKIIEEEKIIAEAENTKQTIETDTVLSDSVMNQKLISQFGAFSNAATGNNEFITIKNNKVSVTVSTLGGRPYTVELLEYKRFDSTQLILFNGDSTIFGLNFFAQNRNISTNNMFFVPHTVRENELSLRLYADSSRYIEYHYLLENDSNMMKFNINFVGINDLISDNSNYMSLKWNINAPRQEKGAQFENSYTTIYWKYNEDEVDYLSETSDDKENIRTKVKWIAFKQHFFSSILIADDAFLSADIISTNLNNHNNYLKNFNADISLPFEFKKQYSIPLKFYFGPNKYNTLAEQGENLELERVVPLGWSFFLMQWINRFAVIPVFNFLENYISNYGIIILILTILLKLVLFPLTYKSYLSTAKMRVLKPQVDEINAKIPKEKTMERQQATMAMYRKAGVNPMGGCLPMLLQFPILIALFRFFPASFELRQQSFLWADDLSSYDSVLNLPFEIPFYGDHVSLFTLLMTISTLIYTHMQNKMNPSSTSMPGMKFMMYMMPVMFLFWFNSYASGLSYYYFLANIMTFGQMALIRKFVDDKAVLAKLKEIQKKPKKKSSFQEKLEKMARERSQTVKGRK